MADYEFGILRIIAEIAAIGTGQIAITPTNDAVAGVPVFGYKDALGNSRRCAVLDVAASFTDLTVTGDFSFSGDASTIQETGMASAVGFPDILDNKNDIAVHAGLISANQSNIAGNSISIASLQSGTTNYQLVTTATADIAVTTSIVGVDCDTIGEACALTALTAGLVAGRKIKIIAFGTDINAVSVVGEGGEYFNETETSVEITNDNRTLTLNVVNGGYNVVNPADAQSIWEKDIVDPGDAATANNLVPTYLARQNITTYPMDMRQWVTSTTVAGGITELIGTSASGPHSLQKTATTTVGIKTCEIVLIPDADKSWVRVDNYSQYSHIFNFDLENKVFGTVTTLIDYGFKTLPSGNILVWCTFQTGNTTLIQDIRPGTGDNATTYTGDGVTVDLGIESIHTYDGYRYQGIGFYDNGASTYPLTIKQETRDDFQLRHANGQVLTASGAWEFTENVDGYLMDESPSNVAAMQQAGLIKNVDNDTWTATPVDGELYRPRGSNNYELNKYIEGSVAGQRDEFYWKFGASVTATAGAGTFSETLLSETVIPDGEMLALTVTASITLLGGDGKTQRKIHYVDVAYDGEHTVAADTIGDSIVGTADISVVDMYVNSDRTTDGSGNPIGGGKIEVILSFEQGSGGGSNVLDWVVEIKGNRHYGVGAFC